MKPNYFVYTGNAYPHKNLERLVKAMVLLNSNKKEKVLLKVSSSRSIFAQRLEKLIKDNGAEKYIKLLGFVPDEEINSLYKNSVGFVFPTLDEGFGLPPMEAIRAGTLAIISDIPVLKEVYKDSAIYFNPFDINSIETAMWDALELGDKERKEKINYSQKFVKRYSWQKMAKETLKVYSNYVQ